VKETLNAIFIELGKNTVLRRIIPDVQHGSLNLTAYVRTYEELTSLPHWYDVTGYLIAWQLANYLEPGSSG
jgi:hypothetical protein